jgi:hypothetical protein
LNTITWVNIAAILLSPVIALIIGGVLAQRKEARDRKIWVLSTLIGQRHNLFSDERIRALNLVEYIFGDADEVRRLYRQYLELADVGNDDLTPEQNERLNTKLMELVEAMAKDLGEHGKFTATDFKRGYYPRFFYNQGQQQAKMSAAALAYFEANTPPPKK